MTQLLQRSINGKQLTSMSEKKKKGTNLHQASLSNRESVQHVNRSLDGA